MDFFQKRGEGQSGEERRETERDYEGERDHSEFSQSPLFPKKCNAQYLAITYGTFSPLFEGRTLPKIRDRPWSCRTLGWH